jgi:hypothetical protein
MAKSSIHIANGASGYIAHNSRESWSKSQVFFDEKNEIYNTKKEAFKLYRSELAARSEAYTKKTNQKLQKNTIKHISMVVNLEQRHNMKDLKKLSEYIEAKLDTKVFQIAIHKDEGKLVHKSTGQILTSGEQFFCNPKTKELFFDEKYTQKIDMNEWNVEKNYHAHIEVMGINSEGKSIRGTLNSTLFREFQSKTAEILGMERGKTSKPRYTKEQLTQIRGALKPRKEYQNEKAYGIAFNAMAKELGYLKPQPKRTKRLDTHAFKEREAKANKREALALAKIKDVQAENTRLRAMLKDKGATRSDYAELEKTIRDLKDKAKAKELSFKKLKTLGEELSKRFGIARQEVKSLEAKVAVLETRTRILNQTLDFSLKELGLEVRAKDGLDKIQDALVSRIMTNPKQRLEHYREKLQASKTPQEEAYFVARVSEMHEQIKAEKAQEKRGKSKGIELN